MTSGGSSHFLKRGFPTQDKIAEFHLAIYVAIQIRWLSKRGFQYQDPTWIRSDTLTHVNIKSDHISVLKNLRVNLHRLQLHRVDWSGLERRKRATADNSVWLYRTPTMLYCTHTHTALDCIPLASVLTSTALGLTSRSLLLPQLFSICTLDQQDKQKCCRNYKQDIPNPSRFITYLA